jgi:hypothetical protein
MCVYMCTYVYMCVCIVVVVGKDAVTVKGWAYAGDGRGIARVKVCMYACDCLDM